MSTTFQTVSFKDTDREILEKRRQSFLSAKEGGLMYVEIYSYEY